MKYNKLGSTEIRVSELCFGSLTLSPLQAKLSLEQSKKIILEALDNGINFIDTAEFYQNYEQIRAGITNYNEEVVICSKSYAYTAKGARISVEKALKELGRDYIDIFCLHEQESSMTLKGHEEALVEFSKCKEQGLIRAIGISTHYLAAAKAAVEHPLIDVVQTITNYRGLGIVDGTMAEMLSVIKDLKRAGKGVYGMKPLGGGNLYHSVAKSFKYVSEIKELDSVALGIQRSEELQIAIDFWRNLELNHKLQEKLNTKQRLLHVASWCTGCRKCVEKCSQKAIKIENNIAVINHQQCILCGYCAGECPEFCIKIY